MSRHGKKFAAVVLALVMALTVLTGCGGASGPSYGDLDLGQVNSLLAGADCDATVDSNSSLGSGVRRTAAKVVTGDVKNASDGLNSVKAYVTQSYKVLQVFVIPEDNVLAGSVTMSGAGALGALNTPEKIVAGSVLSYEAMNRNYTKYQAATKRCTNPQGVIYWVIAVMAQ